MSESFHDDFGTNVLDRLGYARVAPWPQAEAYHCIDETCCFLHVAGPSKLQGIGVGISPV